MKRERRDICIRAELGNCSNPIPESRKRRYAKTCSEECRKAWNRERRILKDEIKSRDRRKRYREWRQSEYAKRFWPIIEMETELIFRRDPIRLEMKAIIGTVRMFYRFHVRNSYIKYIAEEILCAHPEYDGLIELRDNRGWLQVYKNDAK